MAWLSVTTYLCLSHREIRRFYQSLRFNEAGDRYRVQLRWVHRWLMLFSALWLLWLPFVALHPFSVAVIYGLLMGCLIGLAAVAHLKTENVKATPNPVARPLLPAELKRKGSWLKKEVKTKAYYLDPELTLVSLAEKLGLTTHELSRIINTALKKNFNDFINDYRIAEVIRKMKDPSVVN